MYEHTFKRFFIFFCILFVFLTQVFFRHTLLSRHSRLLGFGYYSWRYVLSIVLSVAVFVKSQCCL